MKNQAHFCFSEIPLSEQAPFLALCGTTLTKPEFVYTRDMEKPAEEAEYSTLLICKTCLAKSWLPRNEKLRYLYGAVGRQKERSD